MKSTEMLQAEIAYVKSIIKERQVSTSYLNTRVTKLKAELKERGVTEREELRPCPFCGKDAFVLVGDDEGNIHSESYEEDPWSGLSYQIGHEYANDVSCPVASQRGETIGAILYDTREEAIEAWNKRNEGV